MMTGKVQQVITLSDYMFGLHVLVQCVYTPHITMAVWQLL